MEVKSVLALFFLLLLLFLLFRRPVSKFTQFVLFSIGLHSSERTEVQLKVEVSDD